jgi:hypothetical protein
VPPNQMRTPMTGTIEQIGNDIEQLGQWVQIT